MKTLEVHSDSLRYGDTVVINDKMITLSSSNLIRCPFFGTSINGDASHRKVTVVMFPKWFQGKILGYHRQV